MKLHVQETRLAEDPKSSGKEHRRSQMIVPEIAAREEAFNETVREHPVQGRKQ